MPRIGATVLTLALTLNLPACLAADPASDAMPRLEILDAEASEAAPTLHFTLRLDRPAPATVRGVARLRAGTATPGADYRGRGLPFVFPPGATSALLSVPLLDDALDEADETLTARIVQVAHAWPPAAPATGIIRDDDDLRLAILHVNDHHSHLAPESGQADLGTAGGPFDYARGGFPRIAAMIQQLAAASNRPVVRIHAGDAITGTPFYTLFKGEADAALMNAVCFDLFALGNHEFDDADAGLARFLDWLAADDCGTAVLSANVVPAVGTPLAPVTPSDYFQPDAVKTFDRGSVGFIGLTIAKKTRESSSPLPATQFLDEVETARHYVAELRAQGIENIVLVTHYGYANDLALASQVPGIDAIVGGDSHSLLGEFGPFAPDSAGPYPTLTVNADGDPVCVVQAGQYAAVVGELQLRFDRGRLAGCDGTPHLLVGEPTRQGQPVPDPEYTAIRDAIAAIPAVSVVTPDPAAEALLDQFARQVEERMGEVVGMADEPLCMERIPGSGMSMICEKDAVAASGAVLNVNGGFIQQIVTDAFRARAFRANFALQNAGAVRIDVPAGELTLGDIYTLLPFSTTLVEIELTGAEVIQTLEEAVANFLDDSGGSTGSYPYGSGIRWTVDLTQSYPQRFARIEVRSAAGDWTPIDPAARYIVVTNSFAANGGDGYRTFATAVGEGRAVDTFINYAQSFSDWLREDVGGVIRVPEPGEFSTQAIVAP